MLAEFFSKGLLLHYIWSKICEALSAFFKFIQVFDFSEFVELWHSGGEHEFLQQINF